MNRRTFLAGALGAAAAAPSRPNFVIVLCDDLGYGDLGCQGNTTIRTPNLDAFAQSGLRFTDFYASAPVCSASRAGLMTGRTPNRCGVYDWINPGNIMHLRREERTFATILREAGYATAHVGKWHLNGKFNSPEQPQPGDHRFDHWFSTQNNAAPSHENPDNFVRNGKPVGRIEGYSSRIIVDEAIRWLDQTAAAPGGKPFCLFVCFHAPHEPIATAEEFTGMYPRATKRGEALYYGNVSQMDHEFGRLMRRLEPVPNTLKLFTSDNGPETLDRYPGAWRSHGSANPLRSMKLSLYEGGYRIPGMVQWKGHVKPGIVSGEPACGLDVLPTLCDLAGLKTPAGRTLDGTSLAPMLRDGKSQISRTTPLHWHYFNSLDQPTSSLRDGDWKVVAIPALRPEVRTPGGGFRAERDMEWIRKFEFQKFEIYNLRTDISERTDLAAKEPARLRKMADRLTALHEEVKKEGPDWRQITA